MEDLRPIINNLIDKANTQELKILYSFLRALLIK